MKNFEYFSTETGVALDNLLAYDNSWVVDRYMSEMGATREFTERAFSSFKKFMAVCVLTDGNKTTSPAIDGMWHTFILNTKEYGKFCDQYLRGFVHHEPSEEGTDPRLYAKTRQFAEKIFGDLDELVWPKTGKADCSSGCGTMSPRFT